MLSLADAGRTKSSSVGESSSRGRGTQRKTVSKPPNFEEDRRMGNKRLCQKMRRKEGKEKKGEATFKYKANWSVELVFSEDKGDGVRNDIFT